MENEKADIPVKMSDTEVIIYGAGVSIRSSCYPVPERIRTILFKLGTNGLADSRARVYDRNENLLFYLDIKVDEVVLDMQRLKERGGVLRFQNDYVVYIN